jgi:hypothetical protein
MLFLYFLLIIVGMMSLLALVYYLIIKYENYAYKKDKKRVKKKFANKYFQYLLKTVHRK